MSRCKKFSTIGRPYARDAIQYTHVYDDISNDCKGEVQKTLRRDKAQENIIIHQVQESWNHLRDGAQIRSAGGRTTPNSAEIERASNHDVFTRDEDTI
jgi:hypothetical protein